MDAGAGASVDVSIERLGLEGEGIATYQGRALFIPGAFPTERVRVRLEAPGKVLRGHLEAVLAPNPERREAPCHLADRCGGCDWMQLSPDAQQREKERLVVEALVRLGNIAEGSFELLATAATGTDVGTRRRAVLHWESQGLGYFGRRSHALVPVEHCPALVPALEALPGQLRGPLKPIGASLKAVHLLAEGTSVSVALELKHPVRPRSREVAQGLVRSGAAQGVTLLEPGGRAEEVGRPVLQAPAPGRPELLLRLRADGFAQAHVSGVEVLVHRALELLGPTEADRALELYAGNGTFTFALAGRAASVVAVESSGLSLALGAGAGRAGQLENIRWVQGDAMRVCAGLQKEGARFDVLLVDPPRTGAPKLSQYVQPFGVRSLVYVGCDAGSTARDAGRLVAAGLRLRAVQLVDLFPNTHHVEALLAFSA
jgi:23S rRNA (uracil1939-C5)-methyltransferase